MQVMFDKFKVEKEEGRPQESSIPAEVTAALSEGNKKRLIAIKEKFKLLQTCSSMMNMIILASLTWHLWHLAH
jgi:hypothetical protein